MKRVSAYIILFAEDYQTMDVRLVRGTVFHDLRPGAGFKTGDFVKEKLGGLP